MRIDILSIFPEMLAGPLAASLLGKAQADGRLEVVLTNIRDFASDKHCSVDDSPYGGGAGMVMKCEPIFAAVESLRTQNSLKRVILMSPRGERLTQKKMRDLAEAPDLVVLCARYEGVDERISDSLVTEEISIGDYVLSGGEVPALVLVEGISRMLPGVIGDWESVETDSFYAGCLGPPSIRDLRFFAIGRCRMFCVKEIMLPSGGGAKRRPSGLLWTRRPDLLVELDIEGKKLLAEIEHETPISEREK